MVIKKGFVLSPRIFYESELAQKPPHFRELWHWLIHRANHKNRKTKGKLIKRGELITSYAEIIDSLKWYVGGRKETYKPHQIESALKYLLKTKAITKAKTKKILLVTICNYDIYQNPNNYESHYETGSKPDRKPIFKQELKNLKINTHTANDPFSFDEIKVFFKKIAEKENLDIERYAVKKFFTYWQKKRWTYDGSFLTDSKELEPHIHSWLLDDAQKKEKSKNNKPPTFNNKDRVGVEIGDLKIKRWENFKEEDDDEKNN